MSTTSPPVPRISAIEAAQAAIGHTRRTLFPIRLKRWIILGFLAFLDQCGRTLSGGAGGGDGSGHVGDWPGGGRSVGEEVAEAVNTASAWLSAHAIEVAIGVFVGVVLIGLLVALVLWINARGTFMYLDGVASGRTDIGRAWRQHAAAADSYFRWRLAIALSMIVVVLFAAGLAAVVLVAFARGRLEGVAVPIVLAALLPVFAVLLLALPALVLAGVALRDFVAPLQLMSGQACGSAAQVLEGLVTANPGAFIVYLLIKLLAVALTGVVVFVGGCLTCCLGFLPVVMHTLFQPLFFFERSFSVFLLKQMGHDLPARLGAREL